MSKNDTQHALVPRLRFPEFRDDGSWHPHALNDVVRRIKESVAVEDIALEDYVCTENLLTDFGGVGRASNLPPVSTVTQFKPGDTLLANIRPYLKKAWFANRAGGASNDVFVFRSRGHVDPRFLTQMIQNDAFIAYVMSAAKGVKMPRGDLSHIEQYPFPLPTSKLEQRKIADCLGSLDDRIAAAGRKLAALRDHKQGLMQQLFPREGETQPRLRFPEFGNSEGWQTPALAELYGFKRTNTLSRDQLNYDAGTIKNIHYGDIHTKFQARFRVSNEYVPYVNREVPNDSFNGDDFCEEGDIVLADASEDLNDVGKAIEIVSLDGQPVVAGTHTILATRHEDEPIVGFGGYLFQSAAVRAGIHKEAQGAKVYGISANRISTIPVPLPATHAEPNNGRSPIAWIRWTI